MEKRYAHVHYTVYMYVDIDNRCMYKYAFVFLDLCTFNRLLMLHGSTTFTRT